MRHIDLFSGIGGFALAAEMVWPDIKHTFVEYDPFCQAILKKHWPEAEIHGDIKKFTTNTQSERFGETRANIEQHEERTASSDSVSYSDPKSRRRSIRSSKNLRKATRKEHPPRDETFLLTGGFPCQPFSHAGRRKGTEDDRYLWPEMLRVIREFHPTWVIAENVAGLVTWDNGLVFKTVLTDLAAEEYEVQSFIVPAAAVGAPHRRDRIWIVGHAKHHGRDGSKNTKGNSARSDSHTQGTNEFRKFEGTNSIREVAANSSRKRRQQVPRSTSRNESTNERGSTKHRDEFAGHGEDASDTERTGSQKQETKHTAQLRSAVGNNRDGYVTHSSRESVQGNQRKFKAERHSGFSDRTGSNQGGSWSQDWSSVAAQLCIVDDGLPRELARGRRAQIYKAVKHLGREEAERILGGNISLARVDPWRAESLKAAGNAIVPQVATEIMRAIKATETI